MEWNIVYIICMETEWTILLFLQGYLTGSNLLDTMKNTFLRKALPGCDKDQDILKALDKLFCQGKEVSIQDHTLSYPICIGLEFWIHWRLPLSATISIV